MIIIVKINMNMFLIIRKKKLITSSLQKYQEYHIMTLLSTPIKYQLGYQYGYQLQLEIPNGV